MTSANQPAQIEATWIVDADRDRGALRDFLWNLRPGYLRRPFLTFMVGAAAIVSVLAVAVDIPSAWTIVAALAGLLALVFALIALTKAALGTVKIAVESGAQVKAMVTPIGWTTEIDGTETVTRWTEFDRYMVREDCLFLVKIRRGIWIPRGCSYVPLDAFGNNASVLIAYASSSLSPLKTHWLV